MLEDRDDGVGDSRANYGVGKSLYPLPTGDGDVPCSYMKKLTSEAATVEKAVEGGIVAVKEAVEGGDVWEGDERVTAVADEMSLTVTKVKSLVVLSLGHNLWVARGLERRPKV